MILVTSGIISHTALSVFSNELEQFLLRTAEIVFGYARPSK